MGFFSKLVIGRDDNGYVTNEIPWPDVNQANKIGLTAGITESLPVPTWAYRIKYTVAPGGIVWCGHGANPLVPAIGGSFSNEASELNPILRPAFDHLCNRISTLQFLSENDTFLSVIFYRKNDSDVTR